MTEECTRYAVRQIGTELFATAGQWSGPVRLQLAKLYVRQCDAKRRASRLTRRARGAWEVIECTVRTNGNPPR